jgi:hypothetical protein
VCSSSEKIQSAILANYEKHCSGTASIFKPNPMF